MEPRRYELGGVICKVTDVDGAYVEFPLDVRREFGRGHIIGLRKDLRAKIGKQPGDRVRVVLRERD